MYQKSVNFSELARSRKNKMPISPLDTANNCKKLAEEYDLAISATIAANMPLGIEQLLDKPFLIASELCEAGTIDEETRRLILLVDHILM